jgi:hypothetical protein
MDDQQSQDTEALLDAVDILADVVDIDLSSDEAVEKGKKNADALKLKFTVIHNYLKDVNKVKSVDQKLARGVQSIIQLASEAATKIDRILQQQGVKGERFSSSKEFTDLISFYKEAF